MSLTATFLAAALPAATDAIKTLFGGLARKLGGMSVDDEIKLQGATVERLKALAELDKPVGEPAPWVVNLRASFRYISAGVSILIGAGCVWAGTTLKTPELTGAGFELISIPFAFIFGERMYLNFKGSK